MYVYRSNDQRTFHNKLSIQAIILKPLDFHIQAYQSWHTLSNTYIDQVRHNSQVKGEGWVIC